MALPNSTYEAVMRRYDEMRSDMREALASRTREVTARIPRIEELNALTSEVSLEAARSRIADPSFDLTSYEEKLKEISDEKARLLLQAGYPADYLDMKYSCPLCRDTGIYEGGRCRCFNRIAADLIYGEEALGAVLEAENFSTARFDMYPDSPADPDTGRSPRQTAIEAFRKAEFLAENIDKTPYYLFITGNTGVGKTFLAHACAKSAADLGCSVLIFSAPDFFDIMGGEAFGRSGGDGMRKLAYGCDLLVIDDLGTEVNNSFVSSELFKFVNGRLDAGKSTIISSNLDLGDLSRKYSERIFSRIASRYTIIELLGDDIRLGEALR